MSVRLRELLVPAIGLVAGCLLPLNTLAGDAGRIGATFLGLFAASVLPTVTLLLTNMVSGARSVQKIQELEEELRVSVDTLFLILGFAGLAFVSLVLLAIPTPAIVADYILGPAALNRFGQGLVVASVILLIQKSAAIPNSIRRSLRLKSELALEEAKIETRENAPKPGEAAKLFSNPEGFGRVVPLSEIGEQNG